MNTKQDFSWLLSLLKAGTYAFVGAVADASVQAMSSGLDVKRALVVGVAVGVVSGVKNVVKHKFDIDLDLTKLAK